MNESPLITIREAERAAAELVETARHEAEDELEGARARAAEMLVEAEEQGRHVALRLHQEALEAAQADARQLVSEGEARAANVSDLAKPYLSQAVAALVEFVLPGGNTEEA